MITQAQMVYFLAAAQVIFAERQVSKELVQIWHKLFQNEDFDVFEMVFMSAIKECKFFPRPEDIETKLRAVREIKQVGLAEKAWAIVLTCASTNDIKTINRLENICYPARMALSVVNFEEIRLCNIETELPWKRKEFLRVFSEFAEAGKKLKRINLSYDHVKSIDQSGIIKKCISNQN
jgi:hypothetical protein